MFILYMNSRDVGGRGEPSLATLGGREHHCELQQTPRPDGQRQQYQNGFLRYLLVLERVKELYNVRSCTDVHQQQLGQLVSGQFTYETESFSGLNNLTM